MSGESGLVAELARVEALLAATTRAPVVPPPPQQSAFARAARLFGLDDFERWLLTLATAAEIEPRIAAQLARRPDNLGATWPTLGLAAAVIGGSPHRSAFEAAAKLRAAALVELEGNGPVRAIRLRAGVAAALVGVEPVDVATAQTLATLDLEAPTRSACEDVARRIAAGETLTIVLSGPPGSGRDALAAAIAASAGTRGIARSIASLDAFHDLLRDATWHDVLPIACDVDPAVAVTALGPQRRPRSIVLVGRGSLAVQLAQAGREGVVIIEVARPTTRARIRLWSAAVPAATRAHDLDLDSIGHRYRLGPAQIAAAARLARAMPDVDGHLSMSAVEAACRAVSISALDDLAERLVRSHTIDDLVVLPATRRELELAIAWARTGSAVFSADGNGRALDRGPGLACLFHGPSGTGKTLAARVLGNAIGLDVYRVDLSQVMDKYIGETEKRLERLFAEAERGNAILFFDEADVLFAKRTEVGDARDRYANLETGYLLQRIERHPGIVILATNLRDNIDSAFLRRIHVIAELPHPKIAEREAIWRRLMPPRYATDIDLAWLAQRFPMTGGEINNAIATGLLLAAANARDVAMADLVFGVWREVNKSGRLVEASQFGAWSDRVIELAGEHRIGTA